MARRQFDASYYRTFYGGEHRVHGAREVAQLASGVCGFAAWLNVDVRSVLDVGAGVGLWGRWFARHRPHVTCHSIDISPYACRTYGHELRDIAAWRSARRYDLVLCHSVLQYLPDRRAERAIRNLGAMAGGLMYLEVIAAEDADVLDHDHTDLECHLRPAAWYRERLVRHFVQIGAGLWASRKSGVRLYALEGASECAARGGTRPSSARVRRCGTR